MKVLAIDPGYARIGFAVLLKENGVITLIHSECFETKMNTAYKARLVQVGKHLEHLIQNYKPEQAAIENLFFAKNKKTAMQVAEVRGICIYQAEKQGVSITEHTPNQVKSAITGNGNATKEQMMRMIPHLLQIKKTDKKRVDDEYDAIAIGITHLVAHKVQRNK